MKLLEIQASLKGTNLIITVAIKMIITSAGTIISSEYRVTFINNVIQVPSSC